MAPEALPTVLLIVGVVPSRSLKYALPRLRKLRWKLPTSRSAMNTLKLAYTVSACAPKVWTSAVIAAIWNPIALIWTRLRKLVSCAAMRPPSKADARASSGSVAASSGMVISTCRRRGFDGGRSRCRMGVEV